MPDTSRDHPLPTALATAAQARPARRATPVKCLPLWPTVGCHKTRFRARARPIAEGKDRP